MQLTQFQELWRVIALYDVDKITQTEIKTFNETGLTSNLSDIFHIGDNELVTVLSDGSVRKTIVYISEMKKWGLEKGFSYPKFHIYNCKTLVKMAQNDRSYRYKKTSRYDGLFLMVISGDHHGQSDTKFIELELCKNCLNLYNANHNTQHEKKDFNIKQYLEAPIRIDTYSLDNTQFEEDLETVPIHYAQNWVQISNELKRLKNYICQKCGVNLQNAPQYLHTHHMDSNPSNNVVDNLKVLCISCHAEQFNHHHIKTNPMYWAFLEHQGIV